LFEDNIPSTPLKCGSPIRQKQNESASAVNVFDQNMEIQNLFYSASKHQVKQQYKD
jgi:hypothetical protein